MSLHNGYNQLQQQAWAPRSSIFCPHCCLSVQRDSKVVVLEISLINLQQPETCPGQIYREGINEGQVFIQLQGMCRVPLSASSEAEADARQVLSLQLTSSVDTGRANSHQPFWQQWSMNSKHHRQFQMCIYLMVQAAMMRGSWDIYALHRRPTGCRELRKYCVVESENDATVVLSMRWKSQHYAKGKMSGLAGKGNGLVHWLSFRVPDWLANVVGPGTSYKMHKWVQQHIKQI